MKALVTGATGFIGSYLAEALIKKGYEVTCLVRRTSETKWIEHLDIDYLFCDLQDVEFHERKLGDFSHIFHVAGLTKARTEHDFFVANADGTERLLRAAATTTRLERFIYVSSLAASGPAAAGGPVQEDSVPSPVSAYGRSKLAGEKAVLEYRERMPVTIIRPPAVYGPRDRDFLVMFQMIKKGVFPYWGRCRYSMLYIEDLIQGILLCAEKNEAVGKTFFLSDGVAYVSDEIIEEISAALHSKVMKIRIPRVCMPLIAFLGEKMDKKGIINRDKLEELRYSDWTCDAGRAERELGFKSKITLREGIRWTADWYRIHRWL